MNEEKPGLIRPYSENIIFYDSEFSSLNPYIGEILSIGMVKMNGEELYLEVEKTAIELDKWVVKHVVPHLRGGAVSRVEAVETLRRFIGEEKPYLVSFVNQYDTIYLHKLFDVKRNTREEVPQHWIHIDFASILFGFGDNPESYRLENEDLFRTMGIDPSRFNKHFALDDAKLLKELYMRYYQKRGSILGNIEVE